MRKVNLCVLSDIIDKKQSEHVVKTISRAKKYFNECISKKPVHAILDEVNSMYHNSYGINSLSFALSELENSYVLNYPDVRELVPLTRYCTKDSYEMTIDEYYLLGAEVNVNESNGFINFYIIVIENMRYPKLMITRNFLTKYLVKDNAYTPVQLDKILNKLIIS